MVEQILAGVNPTRMELLETRKKMLLAEKGHQLLEDKRDALVEKFFEKIEHRNELKKEIEHESHEAFLALIQAQMLLGEQNVEDLSYHSKEALEVFFQNDNIMGIKIPTLTTKEPETAGPSYPFYGFTETCAKLDETYLRFTALLKKLIALAEMDSAITALSVDIEKTKRRVNVLENTLIPRLHATIKYIEMQLDEREREDFFRRKRIKTIMEKKNQ